ncbi:5-formyltetrahydrofolate cyclo-ligase [Nocardioides iriomotensis]|uniref:5-formyltetrahydrofolate cyclo-ligase n=1 Tax=Nocardioides iriomotensis TaxID=715784 RepID=A0A4Q5ITQ0_9ACTN|nr:5-formyltetrahydrofolate cyclo-ligase [Nocardioides iriomotensis]RYU08421.1 5-formyltetrahydrofolate cyclo-ligase [Nocardioides iriomotensis]
MDERETVPVDGAKIALRDQLSTARRRRSLLDVGESGRAIAQHLLATPEVRRAATVAAYVSRGLEPGTGPLIDAVRASGRHVILPVVLPDKDLDWGRYTGADGLADARFGLLEPAEPHLGVDAVATADVVLVPAVAVDRSGMRLGRGGGCYDRALARVPVGTFVCALLYDDEVLDAVPSAPHDRRVTAVVTPSGVTRLA